MDPVDDLFPKASMCKVQAEWAGYQANAPVPLQGGPQPENVTVVLDEWTYFPKSKLPISRMEVRFLLGRKIIHRKRLAPVFSTPAVLTKAKVKKEPGPRESRKNLPPKYLRKASNNSKQLSLAIGLWFEYDY